MSDHSHADTLSGATGQAASGAGTQPTLLIGNQYVRSMAMSVPNTPDVFAQLPPQAHIALTLDVNARQLGDNQPNFEVSLVMRVQGLSGPQAEGQPAPQKLPQKLYECDLAYAGVFALQNATTETLEPLLLIEAPRMLYPAARNVIVTAVREAGFPPINLQPVDFVALWQARRARA